MIAQHWETVDADFLEHTKNFERRLRNLAATNPLFINSQTGKDYYSFDKNKALFDLASQISIETSIPVLHETHRGKWSFAAHVTKDYLERLPELKIALDISHWCVTAESFLEDQEEAVHTAIRSAGHLHARVGYTEGPQVPDPRVSQWKPALERHFMWWDQVIEKAAKEGKTTFTVTAEFGVPPYMVQHPQTGKPLVNQWEVNAWMMGVFKKRYI